MPDGAFKLSDRARLIVMAATTLVVLALVNSQIAGKESIVRHGSIILLELAPVDPRSLMQGDYLALRYAITGAVADAAAASGISDGQVVVELDERGAAQFVAIYDGQQLTDTQHLLRFRKRGDSVRLASDAYFFQQGHGELYEHARFGELRVADDGEAVLTGLRDADRAPLGPPRP